jgi:hypothetical protein
MDIGSPIVLVSRRWPKPLVLCGFLLLLGGCDTGGDQLSELVTKFPLQRVELGEARQLIQTLVGTEGISEIRIGPLYDESPDKVRFRRNSPDSPLVLLGAIQLKDSKNKDQLEQLRAVGRRISCQAVSVDESNQVWVEMYYGRNSSYGYVFLEVNDKSSQKDGNYITIPGEENWHAFRR